MTVPTHTALEVPQTGLGTALGHGLGQGITLGLQGLLKNYLATKQQEGLTPFQEISTQQREKERKRKTENAVVSALNSLADIKKGVVLPDDVPSIATNVVDLIEKGTNATAALEKGVSDYRSQRLSLSELNIPVFKAKNAEKLREETINKFRENNIKNQSVIARNLKKKKWTSKEIQKIVKAIKGFPRQEIQDKMPPVTQQVTDVVEQKKAPLRSLSQQEIASRYQKMPGKTHKKKLENLKKVLMREGYSIQGI